jgi:hypothetical protein
MVVALQKSLLVLKTEKNNSTCLDKSNVSLFLGIVENYFFSDFFPPFFLLEKPK